MDEWSLPMKRFSSLLIISWCLIIFPNSSFADQALSFHIDTSEGGDVSKRRIEALKNYLQLNQCNIQKITTAQHSAEKNQHHIIFSPLQIEANTGMKKLAELRLINNQPLAGSILVKSATGIKDIRNLDGVRIAFLSKNSSTGYQLQQQLFQQAGIHHKDDKITFTQTHSAATTLLLHGDVFAAAIATPLAKKWAKANDLIIVTTSDKVTAGGLWASQNIPEDIFQHCSIAFVNITADSNKRLLKIFPAWLDSFSNL